MAENGPAVAAAVLVTAPGRLPSLVSPLVHACLAFVVNLALVTFARSPFQELEEEGGRVLASSRSLAIASFRVPRWGIASMHRAGS